MDRAGLITLEQARAAGLSFDEPEPRACPHCGAALDPLGAALADRLARRGERVTAEAIASRISQTCRPVYLGGRDRRRLG